ncbi:MAG: hydrolase, partial [Flavobacteriaceae bacterium]
CNRVMGYHFDTFGYIEINHEEATKSFSSENKELILLEIGKSIEI